MANQEEKKSPRNAVFSTKQSDALNCMFSPRFKTVAEMAGWDEEAILIASLIVEDTPDRDSKEKRRSELQFKTPPISSRRKRRAQRHTSMVPITILDLDDEDSPKHESEKKKTGPRNDANEERKLGKNNVSAKKTDVACSDASLPCMDLLKEELSCAICLDICFEPSTTSCGHSFCKKCLRSAADKCGKRCPKCRQLISNGRSCTVNTVLWNTIQLLFPEEVEARKEAVAVINNRKADKETPKRGTRYTVRNRIPSRNDDANVGRSRGIPSQDGVQNRIQSRDDDANVRRRSRGIPTQDEDAALALRLQREEFMEVYRGELSSSSLSSARSNLRAMASRAMNFRLRRRFS